MTSQILSVLIDFSLVGFPVAFYPLILTTSDSYNFGTKQDIKKRKTAIFLLFSALPTGRIKLWSKT